MSDAAQFGPFMGLLQSVLSQGGMRYDQGSGQMLPMRGAAPAAGGGAGAAPGSPMGASAPPVSPATGAAGPATTTGGGGGGAGGYTAMASMPPSAAAGITPTSASFYDLANQFTGSR